MDYAICYAIAYSATVYSILLLYDIICQFWINFLKRVQQCPILPPLPDKPIIPGIGLFHVHGHKKECYPRYAPSFIPGAGMIDGEILETLWNPLNHTASSARSMTWYSRQEYLDAHMGDSNWKKLIHMGKLVFSQISLFNCVGTVASITRKWQACVEQVEESSRRFSTLSAALPSEIVSEWTSSETLMQELRSVEVEIMDDYDVREEQGKLFPKYPLFVSH